MELNNLEKFLEKVRRDEFPIGAVVGLSDPSITELAAEAEAVLISNNAWYLKGGSEVQFFYVQQDRQMTNCGEINIVNNECFIPNVKSPADLGALTGFQPGSTDANLNFRVKARGNHVNGYCYNPLGADKVVDGVVKVDQSTFKQSGHDPSACVSNPNGKQVFDGWFYADQKADFKDNCWSGTVSLADQYCTNCCKLGYVVKFDPDNGDPQWSVALTNFFRNAAIPGAPTKVALPTPAPTKEGRACTGWYNGGEKWNFGSDVTSSMTLKAEYALPSGPIWVYRMDGAPTYLGGFTSVSNAVAYIDKQDGKMFRVELPNADPNDSSKPFVTTEGAAGVYVKTVKSLRVVGGCKHGGVRPEDGPTAVEGFDHTNGDSYGSEISNCRFRLLGTNETFAIENVKLTGESYITKGCWAGGQPEHRGWDANGKAFTFGSITVSNCYCSVTSKFPGEGKGNEPFGAVYANNGVVLFSQKDDGGVNELVVRDNTFVFPNIDELKTGIRVVGGDVSPTNCVIVGNTIGSAEIPFKGNIMGGDYKWSNGKPQATGDWFLCASNVVYMKASGVAGLFEFSLCDIGMVSDPLAATVRDNEISFFESKGGRLQPMSVENFTNFFFFSYSQTNNSFNNKEYYKHCNCCITCNSTKT